MARKLMGTAPVATDMVAPAAVLQGGTLTSPPALLLGVAALAVIILVGRFFLAMAWKLVIIALLALTVLWILGILGVETGIFGLAAGI